MKNINIEEIKTILPHRYPFLLIDKVIDVKKGEDIKAFKTLHTMNLFFRGILQINQ